MYVRFTYPRMCPYKIMHKHHSTTGRRFGSISVAIMSHVMYTSVTQRQQREPLASELT